MIRIVRTAVLRKLAGQADQAEEWKEELREESARYCGALERAERAEAHVERLLRDLGQAHADIASEIVARKQDQIRLRKEAEATAAAVREDIELLRKVAAASETGTQAQGRIALGVLRTLLERSKAQAVERGAALDPFFRLIAELLGPDSAGRSRMRMRLPIRIVRTRTLDALWAKADWADSVDAHYAAALYGLRAAHEDNRRVLERLDEVTDDLQVHILRASHADKLLAEIDTSQVSPRWPISFVPPAGSWPRAGQRKRGYRMNALVSKPAMDLERFRRAHGDVRTWSSTDWEVYQVLTEIALAHGPVGGLRDKVRRRSVAVAVTAYAAALYTVISLASAIRGPQPDRLDRHLDKVVHGPSAGRRPG
ncbi:hypothetical protein NKH77_56145 [Streptomyces sp. M19]